MVPKDHVLNVWSQVRPHVAKGVEYSYGRFETDDVLDMLLEQDFILWIAFDASGIKGIVVTNFAVYPRKKYLYLTFCGGEDGFEWKTQMLKLLQHWAYDNGCDGIEAAGRLGWAKIFKNDGYKMIHQIFEMPAATVGLGG